MSALFYIDPRPPHDPETCGREPCGRCTPPRKTTAPAIARNPHDAEVPRSRPGQVVASVGLPGHPEPAVIATALRAMADAIDDDGMRAIGMAAVLASRGYSAATLGDGGSRGTDSTSSTERQGLRYVPGIDERTGKPLPLPPDRKWLAADVHYASLLRDLWKISLRGKSTTDELLRHASDVDPLPAGTGECRACARFVRPDKGKGDRIRSGLCQTCYRAWNRYDGDDLWAAWVSKRRESYSERDGAGNLVAIHTPEPDHDLAGDNTDTGSEQGDP